MERNPRKRMAENEFTKVANSDFESPIFIFLRLFLLFAPSIILLKRVIKDFFFFTGREV